MRENYVESSYHIKKRLINELTFESIQISDVQRGRGTPNKNSL